MTMICDKCKGKGGFEQTTSYEVLTEPHLGACYSARAKRYKTTRTTCSKCAGTGKLHTVQVTDWCDICNGTGEISRSQEIHKTYKTGRQLPTGEYKKWKETCNGCKGSGKKIYTQTRAGEDPSKKGGCYITTAVCQANNFSNSEYILKIFREYRDNWLKKQNNGNELINKYYNEAPLILASIDNANKEILKDVWNEHLKKCLDLIIDKKEQEALYVYINMVEFLKKSTNNEPQRYV